MIWQGSEKRKFPRADISCKITIYFPKEHFLSARTENIGCGGLRVILRENLNVSSVVGMEISFDGDKIIKCKGRIVWKLENRSNLAEGGASYDFGIEFMDVKDSDREKIEKLVDGLLQS